MKRFRKKKEELLRDIEDKVKRRNEEVGKCMREAQEDRDEVNEKEKKIANKVSGVAVSKWEGR